MKKRTACFGWTKKFQRAIAYAADLSRQGHHELAAIRIGKVKLDHRNRVKQLRGVA